MKRDGYISWDQYFMSIALMSAERSKDPNTQVGACIVDGDNRILSVGYNGMPTGCDDDNMPWNRDGDGLASKYFFVCHAELNAILNYRGNSNLKGAKVYVTLFPCNECAKAIIQSGISEIIYMQDKYSDAESTIASKRMFDMAGVKYTPYENKHKKIEFEV
jgi:dCMP deaminase